ncbi:MAG: hemolysin family protein, partial [Acidimicrobiales bacterium]
PNPTAKLLGRPFKIYSIIATPFIVITDSTADWLTRRMGVEPAHELKQLPEIEDLEFLVRSSGEEGTLDAGEVELLTRTLRFGDKTADDVMIPRIDVHAVDSDTTVADLVALSRATGKSRFPVIRGDLDSVASIVHVKAALAIEPDKRETTPVTEISREVLAVPESRDLVSLMLDMRARGAQMAVVVDEHGGTAGIVSLEDLLEEIVGEIDDEHDRATEMTVVEDDGVFVLSGGLHRDEVRDACGFDYPDGNYETLAGFVLDQLQRIPSAGEILRHDGWRIEVVEMDRRRIATLRLSAPKSTQMPASSTAENGSR